MTLGFLVKIEGEFSELLSHPFLDSLKETPYFEMTNKQARWVLICQIFNILNLLWRRDNRQSQYNLAIKLIFQVD